MEIKIKDYPYNKDFAFSITIDDLHPESIEDLEKLDFGSNVSKKPLKIIAKAIEKNKELRFTLFTVPSWIDRSDLPSGIFFPLRKIFRKRRSYPKDRFNIANDKYKDWVEMINNFYPKNIEIAQHGLLHFNPDTKYFRSEEFAGLDRKQTEERILEMANTFKRSGIRHSLGFRPPGWFFNQKFIELLPKLGISYGAFKSDMKTPIASENKTNENLISNNIISFTANCYPTQINRAVGIAKNNQNLIIHLHIAKTEFGLVSLTEKFPEQIETLIREISFRTIKDPWFCTLEELAKFFYAKNKITFNINKDFITLNNNSDFDLRGLTFVYRNQTHIIDEIKPHSRLEYQLEKQKTEEVSVVLTVYNGEKDVIDSLRSLTEQTYSNIGITVIDDGSRDNSAKLIKKFIHDTKDKRIKFISQKNQGRSGAKNKGLSLATGKIITFCEDDAIYNKSYLEEAIKHFQNKNVISVIGPHYVLNKNDSLNTRAKDVERRRNFINYKPFSGWFFRTENLKKIGGFNDKLIFGEDVELSHRLLKYFPKGRIVFEEKSKWLHREPANINTYLRRKFKGGIGMAHAYKNNLGRSLIPSSLLIFFTIAVILVLLGLIYLTLIKGMMVASVTIVIVGLLGAGVARYNSVTKVKPFVSESKFILFSFLYIEYLWWSATLLGYALGLIMSDSWINRQLKE